MPKAPDNALEQAAERFYSVLHTLQDDSKTDAEQLLPVAEAQVEKHRALVAEMTGILDRAQAELDRWATAAANLRAAIDPNLEPVGQGLRGRAIAEVAIRVLEESGKAQPIHYRDWQQLVRLAGYRIGGANPDASFLTALHRHPDIESIGNRTGLWKLAEGDA